MNYQQRHAACRARQTRRAGVHRRARDGDHGADRNPHVVTLRSEVARPWLGLPGPSTTASPHARRATLLARRASFGYLSARFGVLDKPGWYRTAHDVERAVLEAFVCMLAVGFYQRR